MIYLYRHHDFKLLVEADNARNAYKIACEKQKSLVSFICDCKGWTGLFNEKKDKING